MTTRIRIVTTLSISVVLHGICIPSLYSGEAEIETRVYSIQPNSFNTRTNEARSVRPEGRSSIQHFFEEAGVPFPEGASVTFDNRSGVLTVKNTPENLKSFQRVLGRLNVLPTQVVIEIRYLQMSRETADDLFRSEGTLGRVSVVKEDRLQRIHELVRQKEITVLAQPRITTVSGNTAQVKSVEEFRYATEFSFEPPVSTNAPRRVAQEGAIIPGGFETRELGTLLNVTPTLGPDGQTINLTLVPEISSRIEPSTTIEVGTPAGKVAVEQPRFASRQLTTTIQIQNGTTMLLGVVDPLPSDKDKDHVILVLLTATVVYLQ